jgi:uncharacterized membrane protein YhaH (DUF805 family)
MKYYFLAYKRIFDFQGKSSIKEFWVFTLINFIVYFLIGILEGILEVDYIGTIASFITIVPFISLGFRRLNDAGINKWLFFIPIVNLVLASLKRAEN